MNWKRVALATCVVLTLSACSSTISSAVVPSHSVDSKDRLVYLAFGSNASVIDLYQPPGTTPITSIHPESPQLFSGFAFMDSLGRLFATHVKTDGQLAVYVPPYTVNPVIVKNAFEFWQHSNG